MPETKSPNERLLSLFTAAEEARQRALKAYRDLSLSITSSSRTLRTFRSLAQFVERNYFSGCLGIQLWYPIIWTRHSQWLISIEPSSSSSGSFIDMSRRVATIISRP
ncbi:hypothetical protein KCU89_g64, partial [Aureobasidium melanogenum]